MVEGSTSWPRHRQPRSNKPDRRLNPRNSIPGDYEEHPRRQQRLKQHQVSTARHGERRLVKGIADRIGLKGLCGQRDMRDIEEQAQQGNEMARTAIEVFVYRIQKYMGAYTAALGGVDAIVFTTGIGPNGDYIRR